MIQDLIKQHISSALKNLYQAELNENNIVIEKTSADFDGDYTFVVFSYLKISKKSAEQTANEIGNYLSANFSELKSFNVIKGFLNLCIDDKFWIDFLIKNSSNTDFAFNKVKKPNTILVEYSSPNTNKPLHLGHIRNNLLGYAVSEILKANGHLVKTCNLVNDRGVHICKSMLAWMKFGNGENPESSKMKGDHLVGKYYVAFDKQYKKEIEELKSSGLSQEEAEKNAASIIEVQELLRKWEAGDEETVKVWQMMNSWVYDGFDVTYKNLGVSFDKFYYESNTYLLGKDIVNEGLQKNVFYKKDDASVWIDLTADGLDQKLLLRNDGTSVYITQDIGTAELKHKDFNCERSIYVVGNEQEYHFKVLKLICEKLNKLYANGIYHLSYGMVELPEGKMKSREGTVVDADDLIDEMIRTAKETTEALGKTEGLNEIELTELCETVGLGALKYFLLKVDPKKKMLFNPADSIDFHGNTGPFIQYTHARIKSMLRAVTDDLTSCNIEKTSLNKFEKELIYLSYQYTEIINEAAKELSPGLVCNYVFDLAKSFNQFYHECPVLKESNEDQKKLRLMLCNMTANIIKSAFSLLGIKVPERM